MNDDTLTLYFYNDGLSDDERLEVEAALRSDPALAARYAALRQALESWSEAEEHQAPPHLVQRWHASIERAARHEHGQSEKPRGSFSFVAFGWGAAVTAALAIGIGLGTWFAGGDATRPMTPITAIDVAPIEQGGGGAAFTRGLKVHLSDAEKNISSLPVETSADRTMLVMQIIQQNRMFERAAEQNDAANLARVLRAFEPILLRLAADDIAPEDAAALREQLAFELKVMLTILEREASKETQST